MGLSDVFLRARRDPQWESERISKRPLRGPQAEIIQRVERFVEAKEGGVMAIRSARQSGKNEIAATLHRRHLTRHCTSPEVRTWIRTAPTHKPQIVNSKKRLEDILRLDRKKRIRHPLLFNRHLIKSEGYIWQVGKAVVKFLSSGPHSNVVGDTASECLDMDEAHKIDREKFDEDFMPMAADQNAPTLLWGVAGDGLDTIQSYWEHNESIGRKELNLQYPCEIWMDLRPKYRAHVESRVAKLGWDHPIIKTQYRLINVSAMGKFLTEAQKRALLSGDHERHLKPRPDSQYEMLIDVAAGNEDFNPDNILEGNEETKTDSTIVWIYEVTPIVCSNGIFPLIRIRNLSWYTGVDIPNSQAEIEKMIPFWRISKLTVDGIGVGRGLAEALENKFGKMDEGGIVNKYLASDTSVSEDCFDLQARLNFQSVLMFQNDGSPEWAEFERQLGWTRYSSKLGKMKLVKPDATKHIDMVKALTYINRNRPELIMHAIYAIEGNYSV